LEIEDFFIPENQEDFNREVIAPGKHNIWICQLGRKAEDGTFTEFMQNILNAKLIKSGLNVEFNSPGNGVVQFGWAGPLTVNGRIVELDDYPRYDNPYVRADFNPNEIYVQANDKELYLNWDTCERRIQ
jgi:hypothetical protein